MMVLFDNKAPEAVVRRCSVKKVFLKISQNSQENTCARVFFNKGAGLRPATLFKKGLWHRCFSVNFAKFLKETRNSFKKWPLNLWWISNKNIMEIGNIIKAATFNSFLHQNYRNTQLLFLWQCFLIIFMRQTLSDDFWVLHKSKNCAFPLRTPFLTEHLRWLLLKLHHR